MARAPDPERDPRSIEVLLLTQDRCDFCDHAREVLERLAEEYPLRLSVCELESPRGQKLAAEGGILFAPGIFLDGEPFSHGRPSKRRLRRELARRIEAG